MHPSLAQRPPEYGIDAVPRDEPVTFGDEIDFPRVTLPGDRVFHG